MINHNGLTLVSVPNKSPGNIIQIKESPAKNRPKENFIGDDGCFFPNLVHNLAKNGTYSMMKSGFILWNQLDGKLKPNNDNRVCSLANNANTTEPCSSIDQKSTDAMNNGI